MKKEKEESSSRIRPILFSGEMVRAILEGRKTQTRRIVKMPPQRFYKQGEKFEGESGREYKPYANVGDVFWVRETWQKVNDRYIFKADSIADNFKWKPSIFMPREAARIFLKVTNIRVQRLQDISEEDAVKEGIEYSNEFGYKLYTKQDFFSKHLSASDSFMSLWEKINGKGSWGVNPFVWVIEFEKCERH